MPHDIGCGAVIELAICAVRTGHQVSTAQTYLRSPDNEWRLSGGALMTFLSLPSLYQLKCMVVIFNNAWQVTCAISLYWKISMNVASSPEHLFKTFLRMQWVALSRTNDYNDRSNMVKHSLEVQRTSVSMNQTSRVSRVWSCMVGSTCFVNSLVQLTIWAMYIYIYIFYHRAPILLTYVHLLD